MELEELAETVSQKLWLLQPNQLKEVCVEAKIPSEEVITRQVLIKLITESMDNVIDDEEEDVAKQYLSTLLKSVEQIIGNTGKTNSEEVEAEMSLAEKFSQLQLNSQVLQDEVRRLNERVNSASPSQLHKLCCLQL